MLVSFVKDSRIGKTFMSGTIKSRVGLLYSLHMYFLLLLSMFLHVYCFGFLNWLLVGPWHRQEE